MFIDNKYTKIYMKIVNKALTRGDNVLGESHHIIPRSLGGANTKENVVRLTYREHFLVHALLTKMCLEPKHRRSMAFAFISMKGGTKQRPYKNMRLYEHIRKKICHHFSGSNNPFFGKGHFGAENHFYRKKHTKETRAKISQSIQGMNIGQENHFYGKTHTQETREKLRRCQIKPIVVYFTDGQIVRMEDRGELGIMLGKSHHLGHALAKLPHVTGNKCHLWPKYNIERIIYEDHESN